MIFTPLMRRISSGERKANCRLLIFFESPCAMLTSLLHLLELEPHDHAEADQFLEEQLERVAHLNGVDRRRVPAAGTPQRPLAGVGDRDVAALGVAADV